MEGEVNSILTGDYTALRWDRMSIFNLYLRGTGVREMLFLDSVERGERKGVGINIA